ncbi:MAG: hypothetical protein JXA33_23630, partial [Anaerolineae bacterium]|nr:hypothetical protein [Anaerolineae bacterium]
PPEKRVFFDFELRSKSKNTYLKAILVAQSTPIAAKYPAVKKCPVTRNHVSIHQVNPYLKEACFRSKPAARPAGNCPG